MESQTAPEVEQGTDPLDGIVAETGVIATIDTPGVAVDVCAVDDIAIVADQTGGVSVFNVFSGLTPTMIAQVDTPGTALAVSCSGNLVAVADGTRGLQLIDIADPPASGIVGEVLWTQLGGGSTRAVATAGTLALVGSTSGTLAVVDMPRARVIGRLSLGAPIQDVCVAGGGVYVLLEGQVRAFSLTGGRLRSLGSASSPGQIGAGGRRLRLFAGGDVAYASHTFGYNSFTLDDDGRPTLARTCDTNRAGWKHIVANGSGRGFAAVSPNSTNDGPHHVSLYSLATPQTCDVFQAEFPTPGLAAAVAIYNGLGYVADSGRGLQVVSYLPFDRDGAPPTIDLSASFDTRSPVEEGKPHRLTAIVSDDVQVRRVEFYRDGQPVLRDGSFPFEYRFMTPLAENAETVSLQARALDTGGGEAWTDELVVEIRSEIDPPSVVATAPDDMEVLTRVEVVTAFFSEPLDGTSLSPDSLAIESAGPDGSLGTADDELLDDGVVGLDVGGSSVSIEFDAQLPVGLYRATLASGLRDLAGNTLAEGLEWRFEVEEPGFVVRISPAEGRTGETIVVDVFMDLREGAEGWSLGICHDAAALRALSVTHGADAAALRNGFGPELAFLRPDPEVGSGAVSAAVVEVADDGVIGPGTALHIARVEYEILAKPVGGPMEITLSACDDLQLQAGVPLQTVLTVAGRNEVPDAFDGIVTVRPSDE